MKAIVLVAGYSTRLYPLTINQPKGLLPIQGEKTILDFLFEKLERVDAVDEAILISNNRFFENFSRWANNYKGRIKATVLNDGTTSNDDRLGAIGDIQFVIDKMKIDDELMILVSDNYFTFELKDFYDFYKNKGTDCIIGSKFDDLDYLGKNFGVALLDENNRVISMEEKPGIPKSNIGIWASYIYTKDTVRLISKYLKEGNSPDSPGHYPSWLCKFKPIHVFVFEGECYDIGTIKVYEEVKKKLESKL